MRIVHIRDAAHVGQNLVRILRSMGHEAEQILPQENASQSVLVKGLSLLGRVPEALSIGRRVRREAYDIVHLHVANAGWMAALGGYAYVVHCHGSEIRPGLYQPIRGQMARYTLKHALHVFYVTPDLYQHLAPLRPDATLLPNPVDTQRFGPAEATSRDETVRVLIAVPLHRIKAPERAFAAIDLLRRQPGLPPLSVSALGFGKSVARYQQLLNTPDITMLPPRPHEAMATLYHDHDVIIGQLGIGSLGMIELEAMACAKPMICNCDLESYKTSYGQAPPLVSATTAEQIAEALARLVRQKDARLELGAQGRAWVIKHHGDRAVGIKLVATYQQLLDRAGS